MPPEKPCEEHQKSMNELLKNQVVMQKDVEYLRRDVETVLSRLGKHVEDADKDGGWHSRIIRLEEDIRIDKINARIYIFVSGVIGGLIGSGASGAVSKLLNLIS